MPTPTRRAFLKSTAAAASATLVVPHVFGQTTPAASQPERVVLSIMGMGIRGNILAPDFAKLPGVTIKYICDPDETRATEGCKKLLDRTTTRPTVNGVVSPKPVKDFRTTLDDPEVTALVVCAPNHWHTPATLLALAAGKHVYCEKPCSGTPHEGELLLAAAEKYPQLVIQHGTQRRSFPKVVEAAELVRSGAVGKVHLARSWYTNSRVGIGRGKPAPVPTNLDWSLYQGPCVEKEFHDNYVPYNYHWFWHWGNGEAGNNGVHTLDQCRWALGLNDAPVKVTSAGGRYFFDDDQETPDTQFVTIEYSDGLALQWEGRSCAPRGIEGVSVGSAFHGDKGTLVIDGPGYVLYDLKNKELARATGPASNDVHLQNFLDCVRAKDRSKLIAPITDGVPSVLLCHLANISQRTGHTLHVDPKTSQIRYDPEAQKLWSRPYRAGWEPKV